MADVEASNAQNAHDKENVLMKKYAEYYAYIAANPWVQQALSTYDWTKHSCGFLENTLDKMENGVTGAAHLASQKAVGGYNAYVVRPKQAVTSVYNTGVEKTWSAIETSKNVVVRGGTVGLGAAVVATQLGLALSAGGAGLFLDSLGAAHGAGQRVVSSVREAEQAVEKKIWSIITEGQRVAMIPIEKLSESANSLLDIVSVVVERALGIPVEESPESSVKQRVTTLARRIVDALSDKAHSQVIEPVNTQLKNLLEHLSKSFVLVDLVRSKREWALEKVEELSSSVSDLKTRFENEAKLYSTKPEELLMKSIRNTSNQLTENLQSLKDKGQQIFGDGTRVESAITYLQELDQHLADSEDIYQVRDEVLSEARQRLAELTSWTASLLVRDKQ